jgi:hypothetical protein
MHALEQYAIAVGGLVSAAHALKYMVFGPRRRRRSGSRTLPKLGQAFLFMYAVRRLSGRSRGDRR